MKSLKLAKNGRFGWIVPDEAKLAVALRCLAGGDPKDLFLIFTSPTRTCSSASGPAPHASQSSRSPFSSRLFSGDMISKYCRVAGGAALERRLSSFAEQG